MRVFAILTAVATAAVAISADAADEPLMKQAQATFAPIPLTPPAIKGIVSTPSDGRSRQSSLFRSAPFAKS